MSSKRNQSFYAVKHGRSVGIFEGWDECKSSVHGFPGAIYKKFNNEVDAMRFCGHDSVARTSKKDIEMSTNNQNPSVLDPITFYYAVRKGKSVGIFTSWDECKASVHGVSNCEYKKFKYLRDAEEYLKHDELNCVPFKQDAADETCSVFTHTPSCNTLEHAQTGVAISESNADPSTDEDVYSKFEFNRFQDIFKCSEDQQKALQLVLSGASVFITGAAGTGKSFIVPILQLMSKSKSSLWNKTVAFTASTGCAACQINGQTLHTWSGIGNIDITSDDVSLPDVVSKMSKFVTRRWKRTTLLLIDEISMISAPFFEKISEIGSLIRKNEAPFGGLQVVCCGDFLQLPPVEKDKTILSAPYCFTSSAWHKLFGPNLTAKSKGIWEKKPNQNVFVLNQVMRQKDETFCQILNEMRFGCVSDATDCLLRSIQSNSIQSDSNSLLTASMEIGIKVAGDEEEGGVELYSLKKHVESRNMSNMLQLDASPYFFDAVDKRTDRSVFGSLKHKHYSKLLDQETNALRCLELKVGCKVMLIKNLDCKEGLVNGSVGTVLRFEKSQKPGRSQVVPIVQFSRYATKVKLVRSNLELQNFQLALLSPISPKSIGYRLFERFGNYSDLSTSPLRCASMSCLGKRKDCDTLGVEIEPRSDQFYVSLANQSIDCSGVGYLARKRSKVYTECRMEMESFHVSDGSAIIATRMQIPLVLAYGVTIHKVGVQFS